MKQNHYLKPTSFDNWSQDYVVNEITKEHLSALYNLCRQCCMRELLKEEITPHLAALGEHKEKVKMLGNGLVRALTIKDQGLRYDSIMGCLEGIYFQFGAR